MSSTTSSRILTLLSLLQTRRGMRRDVRTDWTVRDDVRAKLRSSIKRLLMKYKYPPDKQPEAIGLVMEQMEALAPRFAEERAEGAEGRRGGSTPDTSDDPRIMPHRTPMKDRDRVRDSLPTTKLPPY